MPAKNAREKTETVVYFATNRRLLDPPGQAVFSADFTPDFDQFRVGRATVTGDLLYTKDLEGVANGAKIDVEPETKDKNDARDSVVGTAALFPEIRERMLAGADAILLIHGFNYSFRESVGRAAQLSQWLTPTGSRCGRALTPPVILLFSWPSRGLGASPALYSDDRRRAEASGVALGRAILKAADFIRAIQRDHRCKSSIHLLAHSMGNWALRGAVRSMRTFVGNNLPPLFDEVILTAADEDTDALGEVGKLAPMLGSCRRVTVYLNQQDVALKASDLAMGNPDRLGRSGPPESQTLPPKVQVVTVAPVVRWDVGAGQPRWTEDDTGHQYYRNNPEVQADMLEVLDGTSSADIPGRSRTQDGRWWRLG
jgi:esterase/lipase superfamily enzyme